MPTPRSNKATADHPHGGGRGKSKGNVDPVSPWGMPVSHGDSSLGSIHLLNLRRPKEDTRLEKLENQTNGLSQLGNEITGNEESSSGLCFLWSFTTLHSAMYKSRSEGISYHRNCKILYNWLGCVP
jgi:hypothetical protein